MIHYIGNAWEIPLYIDVSSLENDRACICYTYPEMIYGLPLLGNGFTAFIIVDFHIFPLHGLMIFQMANPLLMDIQAYRGYTTLMVKKCGMFTTCQPQWWENDNVFNDNGYSIYIYANCNILIVCIYIYVILQYTIIYHLVYDI